jgi:hypothetical protein
MTRFTAGDLKSAGGSSVSFVSSVVKLRVPRNRDATESTTALAAR